MSEPGPPISAQLLPSQQVAQSGGKLGYTVLNTCGRTISFGETYRLEQLTESGWRTLRLRTRFRLPLYRLAPGHARELRAQLPPRMSSGHYRLTKEIREYPPSRTYRDPRPERFEASCEFEVGREPEPATGKLV